MDDIERDDLGYNSDTGMSGIDWREPLQETPREQTEAWENTGFKEGAADQGEGQPAEELWEPEKIEGVDSESGA